MSVKLLLHMDGDQGDTGHNVTSNGDPKLDTSEKKFGSSSMYFDGSIDYLSVANSADWDFGSGNFVIDFWIKTNGFSSDGGFLTFKKPSGDNHWLYGWNFQRDGGTELFQFRIGNGASNKHITVATDNDDWTNTWQHVAIVRSGNTLYSYMDGTRIDTEDVTGHTMDPTDCTSLFIGKLDWGGEQYFTGNLDEVRISKGTDRGWTGATITVPTSEYTSDSDTKLLLHFNSDISGQEHEITFNGNTQISVSPTKWNGSYYFDGTGDYLSVPYHADWDLVSDTTSYTIDFWVKHIDHAGPEGYISQRLDGSNQWWIAHEHGSGIRFNTTGTTIDSGWIGGAEITDTDWHHIALVKNSTTYTLYKDGTSIWNTTNSDTNTYTNGPLYIGDISGSSTYPFNGYMDEVRISHAALWTSNFTPPTEPYTIYRITGELNNTTRILMLRETDWSIIENQEISNSSYNIPFTTNDPLTIIGRKSDGESMGYGNITPQ